MATRATSERVRLAAARTTSAAARRHAFQTSVPVSGVVDTATQLGTTAHINGPSLDINVASPGMGQTWLGSIDIAHGKASTPRIVGMRTDAAAPPSRGQPHPGTFASSEGPLGVFQGGVPLDAPGALPWPLWIYSACFAERLF